MTPTPKKSAGLAPLAGAKSLSPEEAEARAAALQDVVDPYAAAAGLADLRLAALEESLRVAEASGMHGLTRVLRAALHS